jgi:hypothetical protein
LLFSSVAALLFSHCCINFFHTIMSTLFVLLPQSSRDVAYILLALLLPLFSSCCYLILLAMLPLLYLCCCFYSFHTTTLLFSCSKYLLAYQDVFFCVSCFLFPLSI